MSALHELPHAALPVYSARPSLHVAGREEPALAAQLVGLRLHQRLDAPALLQLRLGNWAVDEGGRADFAHTPRGALQPGATLALRFSDTRLFEGLISAIGLSAGERQGPLFSVQAEDALERLRRARRSASAAQQSLAELLRDRCGALGLGAEVAGLDAVRAVWAQGNESDLAFLQRLLAAQDACLVASSAQQVWAGPRTALARGSLALRLGEQLRSVEVEADLAQQATALAVAGFDPLQGQPVSAQGQALALGPGRGLRGDACLARSGVTRAEFIAAQALQTSEEAQSLADAAWSQRLRRFVVVRGVSEGDPRLQPGTQLDLSGLGAWFNNSYQTVEAWHLFDGVEGYRTEFLAQGAYLGQG